MFLCELADPFFVPPGQHLHAIVISSCGQPESHHVTVAAGKTDTTGSPLIRLVQLNASIAKKPVQTD